MLEFAMNSTATARPARRRRLVLIVAGIFALLGSFVAPAQAGYYGYANGYGYGGYYRPCSSRCGCGGYGGCYRRYYGGCGGYGGCYRRYYGGCGGYGGC